MIVAIYLSELSLTLPINNIVPVAPTNRPKKERRDKDQKRSAIYKTTTKAKNASPRSYTLDGFVIEQEQTFDQFV